MLQVLGNLDEVLPYAPSYKASGGSIMAHETQTKVHLKKRNYIIKAKVVGSSKLPEADAQFTIWSRRKHH